MKLHVISDMHYRTPRDVCIKDEAQVLVCAGDGGNARFPDQHRLVFVPGNHEYYGDEADNYMAIRYIEGQRFLCATLWTNFMGRPNPLIKYSINDFNFIGGMTVELMQIFHKEALQFLHDYWTEDDIIVTHFPPVIECHNDNFPLDYVSDYFNNDIRGIKPKLWISGHTHKDHDFIMAGTRYFSSQCGEGKVIEID